MGTMGPRRRVRETERACEWDDAKEEQKERAGGAVQEPREV
jgi:hypothetical protein